MAYNMLKRVLFQLPRLKYNHANLLFKRNVLVSPHLCEEVWNERKNSPILKKVKVSDFAMRIQEKMDTEGVQAIDMDILANKLDELETQQWDFALNLLYRFRHTNESIKAPESLSHAVVRALVKHNEYKKLFDILPDKTNYGIFLDDFSAIYLLDHFLKKELFYEAAQVAYDMMLQEDFGHPLVRHLSWLACVKHLKASQVGKVDEVSGEATEGEAEAEEEEEQWIPINFIRNPWYDDHWDINRDSLLLGKTLNMIASQEEGVLSASYKVVGLGFHEKFEHGIQFLNDTLANDSTEVLAKEAINLFLSTLENLETKEKETEEKDPGEVTMDDVRPYITAAQKVDLIQQANACVSELESKGKLVEMSLEEKLIEKVNKVAELCKENDVASQEKLYKTWEVERENAVQEQIDAIRNEQLRTDIAKKLIEMQKREERLSYFEDLQKIKLGISQAPQFKPIEDVIEEEQFVLPPAERGRGN